MKGRVQALVCTVFFIAVYFGCHYGLAMVPFDGDTAWRTIAANALAVGIGLLTAFGLGDRPLRPTKKRSATSVMISGALGGGFAGAVLLAMTWVPIPPAWMDTYTQAAGDPSDKTTVALVSALVMAPIAEEIMFRGLIYRQLKRAMFAVPAAIVVSVGFGAIHGTILWGIYTCLLGLLAVWVMERTGSLWAAIAFHGMFNLFGQLPSLVTLPSWAQAIYPIAGAAVFVSAGATLLFRRAK